jgi:hypothetical protein
MGGETNRHFLALARYLINKLFVTLYHSLDLGLHPRPERLLKSSTIGMLNVVTMNFDC